MSEAAEIHLVMPDRDDTIRFDLLWDEGLDSYVVSDWISA
jgi:hypothetical protein